MAALPADSPLWSVSPAPCFRTATANGPIHSAGLCASKITPRKSDRPSFGPASPGALIISLLAIGRHVLLTISQCRFMQRFGNSRCENTNHCPDLRHWYQNSIPMAPWLNQLGCTCGPTHGHPVYGSVLASANHLTIPTSTLLAAYRTAMAATGKTRPHSTSTPSVFAAAARSLPTHAISGEV